ncbi:Cysteine proteinase 15A [Senna tora]|uniref:Cysteine proteinase 15A n=1 Tax=Senna tora TaxID=362788 RepID=A0A834TG52_9FABA|nr:Cysteine proteinase 15A [Senna tora]
MLFNLQRRRFTSGGESIGSRPALDAGVKPLELLRRQIRERRDAVDGGGVQRLVLRGSDQVLGENPEAVQILLSARILLPVSFREDLELLLGAEKMLILLVLAEPPFTSVEERVERRQKEGSTCEAREKHRSDAVEKGEGREGGY